MKVILAAALCVTTVFAARGPEIELLEKPTILVDSGKTSEQIETERLARLAARRAQIAAARERKKITGSGVYYPDGGDKNTVGKGAVVTQPGDVVTRTLTPVTKSSLSAVQEKTIAALAEQEPSFDIAEKHPLSSLNLIETELTRNKTLQEEITGELKEIKGLSPEEEVLQQHHYDELTALYLKLQNEERILNLEKIVNKKLVNMKKGSEQEKILINCQEFLAFCKDSPLPITFTGSDLEEIFILLHLPSLSKDSLDEMPVGELGGLEGSLVTEIRFVSSVKEDGSVTRQVGKVMTDEPTAPKKGYSIDAKGTKTVEKQYFDAGQLTKEKKDILIQYLEDRLKKVTELLNPKNNPSDENVSWDDLDSATKVGLIETRLATTKSRVEDLKQLLGRPTKPTIDWGDYNQQVKDLSDLIQNSRKHLSSTGLTDEGKATYDTLELVSNTALGDLGKLAIARLRNSFKEKTLQPGDFNQYFRIIVMDDSNFPDLVELKKFETVTQDDLTSEQQKFVQKIIKQTETFADLKAQATEAIDANNVIRMQELQDEMRDVYEDVYRNDWKEEDSKDGSSKIVLTDIDAAFLRSMRDSINDLLQQFGKKTASFEGVKNKKSFVDKVQYRFKRLFVRFTLNPTKMRYRSEFSRNKNFRLDVVDFKKVATDGYVATVKSGINSYQENLKEVNARESEFQKDLKNDRESTRNNARVSVGIAIKKLQTQIEALKIIQQQRAVLKGIAACDGTLTYKKVAQSLSVVGLPDDNNFLDGIYRTGEGKDTLYKESARILLEKDGSTEEGEAILTALEEGKDIRDNSGQKEFLLNLYKTWRSTIDVNGKLKAGLRPPDLRLITLLQKEKVDSDYLAMLRSPETRGYVFDAYETGKDVTVPSDQAKTILKQLPDDLDAYLDTKVVTAPLEKVEMMPEKKQGREVNLDSPAPLLTRLFGSKKNKPVSKNLDDLVTDGENTVLRLQKLLLPEAAPAV